MTTIEWTPEKSKEHKARIKTAMQKFKGNDANSRIAKGELPKIDFKVGHRPTKLTPKVWKIIIDGLSGGNYLYTVCEAAGIHQTCYANWIQRGKDGEEPFFSFVIDVKKAMADAEMRLVKVIDSASLKEWTAAAWLLERRMPEKFGKRDNVIINDGKSIDINIQEQKKIEIIARIEAVATRMSINKDENPAIGTIECSSEDCPNEPRPEERVLSDLVGL